MKVGTKSVLYGAHCFFLHPWFVALGWWLIYGFPVDPRLWFCFFFHDIGYVGKPNMDGPEGETHPLLGAAIIRRLFGDKWGDFCLFHSRFYARRSGKRFSRLCVADKMAIVVTPSWLYLPMVRATGELDEYMAIQRESKYHEMGFDHSSPYAWHQSVKRYILAWVQQHKTADMEDGWLVGNGVDARGIPASKLPGYLEGGYVHEKYTILKRDGSPINPQAKYMVMRYDKDRDPHGIFATVAYAISVRRENTELANGILEAVRKEMGLSEEEMFKHYNKVVEGIELAAECFHGY